MLTITDLTLVRDVSGALSISFLAWILAGTGLVHFMRFGVCSVCGAVVSVWALNLGFGFLPGWVTLLLLGQSAVGGSALARDVLFADRLAKASPGQRRVLAARAQMAWFGLLLAATAGLGALGLLWGLDEPLDPAPAALGLAALLGVLALSWIAWVLIGYATQRLWGLSFCQVCAAVTTVWVANLLVGFLPPWATILLMGQSVAGGAALGRDLVAGRFRFDALPETRRRLAKQTTYFTALVTGTAAAVLLAAAAVPVGGL